MSANKTTLPIVFVAILSVPLMMFIINNAMLYISFPVAELVPYVSISLIFIIILNLAMRQALTIYVASIIALITTLHFYIIPDFEGVNNNLQFLNDTKHILLSFITLLPVFGVIKIPAHKILKSVIYLFGSLATWGFFSFVIYKVDLPLLNITEHVFSSIGMQSPFQNFWFSPLQLALISISTVTLFILFVKSVHNIYLLAISSLATLAIVYMSSLSIIVFAILSSVICLLSAIVSSRNMAFNDELTGIPERRSLTQYSEELSDHYTVVMIDIDFFKKFNDKYGHDAGDDVIKLVASKIAKTGYRARAFRYGGEEFTLIFDGKLIGDIRETIEDLRVQLEVYPMAIRIHARHNQSASESKNRRFASVKEDIVKVTCSFGIAESLLGSKDFKATIKRADSALYRAKKGGRNCVRTVES
nr:GGDEF domain-containing protein [uncultured Glaciecola sp.]